jgi:hypothetical protein
MHRLADQHMAFAGTYHATTAHVSVGISSQSVASTSSSCVLSVSLAVQW